MPNQQSESPVMHAREGKPAARVRTGYDDRIRDEWNSRFSGKTPQEIAVDVSQAKQVLEFTVPDFFNPSRSMFAHQVDVYETGVGTQKSRILARTTVELRSKQTDEMLRQAYGLKEAAKKKKEALDMKIYAELKQIREKGALAKLFSFIKFKKQEEALFALCNEMRSTYLSFNDSEWRDTISGVLQRDFLGHGAEHTEESMHQITEVVATFDAKLDEYEQRFLDLMQR